jgi:hypothetical protein
MLDGVSDIHSDELVRTHIGDKPEQEVFPLTGLFHRSIVLQITKRQYIDHLFRLYSKASSIKAIMTILGTATKLSKGHANYKCPEDL